MATLRIRIPHGKGDLPDVDVELRENFRFGWLFFAAVIYFLYY